MKTTFLPLLLALISTTFLYGQTKIIAFKSHSGAKNEFRSNLLHPKNDLAHSNFGVGPTRFVKNAKLDSVIKINEHQVIMVTSEVCHNQFEHPSRQDTKWSPGRDTTFDHIVFTAPISVDSMRSILNKQYFFQNYASETVFVGYDGNKRSNRTHRQSALNQNPSVDMDSSERHTPNFNTSAKEPEIRNGNKSRLPKGSKTLLVLLLLTAGGLFGRTLF